MWKWHTYEEKQFAASSNNGDSNKIEEIIAKIKENWDENIWSIHSLIVQTLICVANKKLHDNETILFIHRKL